MAPSLPVPFVPHSCTIVPSLSSCTAGAQGKTYHQCHGSRKRTTSSSPDSLSDRRATVSTTERYVSSGIANVATSNSWKRLFAKTLIRPFVFFVQEPILQIFGVYMAFLYGTMYCQFIFLPHSFPSILKSLPVSLYTIPIIYSQVYHERVGVAGLHYISLGVGLMTASQINSRMLDKTYIRLTKKNGGVSQPEFRLRSSVFSLGFLF